VEAMLTIFACLINFILFPLIINLSNRNRKFRLCSCFHTRIPPGFLPVLLFSLCQLDLDVALVWYSDEGKTRYKPGYKAQLELDFSVFCLYLGHLNYMTRRWL